ncbi:MAG: hypothetical protein HQM03_19835 [Magnetococcales bacterium]|nr:hypothetical protein [Magnetococcales bacterium]
MSKIVNRMSGLSVVLPGIDTSHQPDPWPPAPDAVDSSGESAPVESTKRAGAPTNAVEFRKAFGVWPWGIDWLTPHPGRASLKPEVCDGMHFHWCGTCGRWGAAGWRGRWRCAAHAE